MMSAPGRVVKDLEIRVPGLLIQNVYATIHSLPLLLLLLLYYIEHTNTIDVVH